MTDAAVVLGYIDPGYFLGGRLALDAEAAHRAIARAIAEPLGFSVQRAAWAILAVANEHMVGAVREITINQGIDPRESIVVAGGGAGGLTMSKIAEELGCDKVLVPQTAAALSATGGLLGRHRRRVHGQPPRGHARVRLRPRQRRARRPSTARSTSSSRRWTSPPRPRLQDYVVEARYPYQVWELDVALPCRRFETEADVAALVDGVPRDPRARLRGQGARPGQSSASTGRGARACTCPSRRWPPPRATAGRPPSVEPRPMWWGADEPELTPVHLGSGVPARRADRRARPSSSSPPPRSSSIPAGLRP